MALTLLVAFANFAVALATSAYTAHSKEVKQDLYVSQEVSELGLSLFVVGFAVGPLFWGPLSELFGRQIIFVSTVSLSRPVKHSQWISDLYL
jgi:MFS family permease